MTIIVYGKKGCGKCEAAKDKLRLLGFVEGTDWTSYDVTDLQARWSSGDDAREITDAMSALAMVSHNTLGDELPVFDIDGKVYTYSEAMKELKRRAK